MAEINSINSSQHYEINPVDEMPPRDGEMKKEKDKYKRTPGKELNNGGLVDCLA